MNRLLLQLYHGLPMPLRSLASSFYGLGLRSWRYGRDTKELVERALQRETWSASQWQVWQDERLAYILHRAATRVPYYREQWMLRRRHGDKTSWQYLENWPLLEKETVRRNSLAFVADDCNIRRMYCDHTSGTTGTPLRLWIRKETMRQWFALIEARWHLWYGVSRHDRWATICGQLVAPVSQRRPPFWVWNAALKQLYLSSYHLSPKYIPYYLDALKRYNVRYIWGYSSSLHAVAQEAVRLKRLVQMRVVITNAEPLYPHQREIIAQAFGCPVRQTYGMSEIVAAASECDAQQFHLWPEAGWIETQENGRPAPRGTVGDLICTGLFNADMPLVRYRLGDCGKLGSPTEICSCGIKLPLLTSLEGRSDDLLYSTDGRYVGRLGPVFQAQLPIRGAQIIQEALDRVRVKYIPTPEFTPEAGGSIVRRLQDRMGKINVILESVEELPRDAAGKFRLVICNIPHEERKMTQNLSNTADYR